MSFMLELEQPSNRLRSKFERQRVGSAASVEGQTSVGASWRALSDEQKAKFQLQADEMQAARTALAGNCLEGGSARAEANANELLSTSQVKRLNSTRLDKSLSKVSEHVAWQRGLGISDHNAALRADLVEFRPDADFARQLKDEFDQAFGYDSTIMPNGSSNPQFLRACCGAHAGTCRCDAHFDLVCRLASNFQACVEGHGMGGQPFLVQLLPGEGRCEVWFIISAISLRPLCHVALHLYECSDRLRFMLRDGRLHIGTVHQALRALVQQHVNSGAEPEGIQIQARLRAELTQAAGPEMLYRCTMLRFALVCRRICSTTLR